MSLSPRGYYTLGKLYGGKRTKYYFYDGVRISEQDGKKLGLKKKPKLTKKPGLAKKPVLSRKPRVKKGRVSFAPFLTRWDPGLEEAIHLKTDPTYLPVKFEQPTMPKIPQNPKKLRLSPRKQKRRRTRTPVKKPKGWKGRADKRKIRLDKILAGETLSPVHQVLSSSELTDEQLHNVVQALEQNQDSSAIVEEIVANSLMRDSPTPASQSMASFLMSSSPRASAGLFDFVGDLDSPILSPIFSPGRGRLSKMFSRFGSPIKPLSLSF